MPTTYPELDIPYKSSYHLITHPPGEDNHVYFMDEETEAPGGKETC